jgi:hypothetical protein
MFKNKDLVNFYLDQCMETLDTRKCVGHFLRLLETSCLFRSILKKRQDLWEILWKDDKCFPWALCPESIQPSCSYTFVEVLRTYALHFKPLLVEKILSFLHVRKIKFHLYELIYTSFYKDNEYDEGKTHYYYAGDRDHYIMISGNIAIYKSGKIRYANDRSRSITLEEFYRPYLNLF